jgi:putative peptidoglycan lipid II flippase
MGKDRSLVRHSAVVSVCNLLNSIAAFASSILIAKYFGLSYLTDAFYVALMIPKILATIFLNIVSPVLIPTYHQIELQRGKAYLNEAISNFLNSSFLVGVSITALLYVSASLIVKLIAPGFSAEGSLVTVRLFRVLSFGVMIALLSEIFRAYLNSLYKFAFTTIGNSFKNIFMIIFLVLGINRYGIFCLAYGFLSGCLGQFLLYYIVARKNAFEYFPKIDFRNEYLRIYFHKIKLPLMGSSIRQLGNIVEKILASFLPAGHLSALSLGQQLIMSISSVSVSGVSTTIFPQISEAAARKNPKELSAKLLEGSKLILFIGVPIIVLLLIFGRQVITIAFERGKFTVQDTKLTANILSILAFWFIPLTLTSLFLAPFFAYHDTKTPTLHMIYMLIAYLLGAVSLYWIWGVYGLVLALVLVNIVSAARTIWILKRVNINIINRLLRQLMLIGGCGLGMFIVLEGLTHLRTLATLPVRISLMFIFLSSACYLLMGHLLGVINLREGLVAIREKIHFLRGAR